MQYLFRKQIGKGFFEEIFAFEAVKLETHRQTGHELGDVAIKERRPDFKRIQHGAAVYLDQDVIEQEFVCVDIEGPLQGRGILPVGKVAESGSKEELFLKESLIRMTEKFFLHLWREGREHGLYAKPSGLRGRAEEVMRGEIEVDVAMGRREPSAQGFENALPQEPGQAPVFLGEGETDIVFIPGPQFV